MREVITNPKHTGHMVWNRRGRKGTGRNRTNPITEWVWSSKPTHDALVDLETFVQAQQVADRRERSRTAPGRNPDPQTKRVYRLRSFLLCHQCGRRLYGKTKRSTPYYVCQPKKAWRADGHPTIYWVREDTLLDGLTEFLATRVFGTYRRELLADTLATIDQTAQRQRQQRITTLRRALTDNDAKAKNLIRSLEVAHDIDANFMREISSRSAELRAHRAQLEHDLDAAQDEIAQAPNPALIDQLPIIEPIDLTDLPDELSRRLFEALRLEIRYDPTSRTASG